MRAALLAPTPYSKYSLVVAELLRLRGVNVCLFIVPSLFNLRRIKVTWRRERTDLLRKIWTKILSSKRDTIETPLDQLMESEGISYQPLAKYCERHGIHYHRVKDLNSRESADAIQQHETDLIVFTGGGLIRKELLESTRIGILNCHWGILPQYRGMDTTIWAEWEQQPTGISLHLMDHGVDTGPIISTHPVARGPEESFEAFHGRLEAMSAEKIVSTARLICQGTVGPVPQEVTQGKQYYIMHDRLREILVNRLENP